MGWSDELIGSVETMPEYSSPVAPAPRPFVPKPVPVQAPVSPGLAPHIKGFLNAIAGPESGGAYNIRYDGKAGAKFDSFADHPRIFVQGPKGKTSAAGRYQFTASTWDSLPSELRKDFSPANQDAGAWYLAQRDYKQRTGRSLDEDLKTQGLSNRILSALGQTWEGFQKNPRKAVDWYNKTIAGKGLPLASEGASPEASPGASPEALPEGALAFAPSETPSESPQRALLEKMGESPAAPEDFGIKPGEVPLADRASASFASFASRRGDAGTEAEREARKSLGILGDEYEQAVKPTNPAEAPEAQKSTSQRIGQGFWDWGHNALQNAVPFGYGPQAEAALEAGQNALAAGVPLGELPSRVASDMGSFLPAIEERKAAYEREHPVAATTSAIAGQMLPIAAGIGATNAGLRAAGRAVPALRGVATGLLGTGGEVMPGLAGQAAYHASNIGSGALQGAVASGMTGNNPLQGALMGGAISGVSNPLLRYLTAPTRATIDPQAQPLMNLFEREAKAINAGRPPEAQIAEKLPITSIVDKGHKGVVSTFAGRPDAGEIEAMNRIMGEKLGAGPAMDALQAKGLMAPGVINKALGEADSKFNQFANRVTLTPDARFRRNFTRWADWVDRELDEMPTSVSMKVGRAIEAAKKDITDDVMSRQVVSGKLYRHMTRAGGTIDQLYKAAEETPAITPYADRLKEMMQDWLVRQAKPEDRKVLEEARNAWRDLHKASKLSAGATDAQTGLVSPKEFARVYGENPTYGQTAQMGHLLPQVTQSGAVSVPGLSGKTHLHSDQQGLSGSIEKLKDMWHHYGPARALPYVAGPVYGLASQAWASPMAGAVGAAGLGGLMFGTNAYRNYLNSPKFQQLLRENTLRQAQGHIPSFVNPLTRVSPIMAPGFGETPEQTRKRKAPRGEKK